MACWACGALFALHTHCQPPQCPHCSTRGGLALLCPPDPLAPSPEAQLRVQARAHLPSAVPRPLLLGPTSLWHMVASSTIHWLSGTREHMLHHHNVALVTPPFFNPHGDMLWFWDAMQQLLPAPTGILCYARRGHEWFLDCNLPPPVVFVITPDCPLCGRPDCRAAVVHGPSGLIHYPEVFCTSPRPLGATCCTELADRSSSAVAGVLVPNAIPVSLTTGERSCFSSAVVPVARPPHTAVARWFLDPPPPPPFPTTLYCNNLGAVVKRYRGASRSVRPSNLESHGTLR